MAAEVPALGLASVEETPQKRPPAPMRIEGPPPVMVPGAFRQLSSKGRWSVRRLLRRMEYLRARFAREEIPTHARSHEAAEYRALWWALESLGVVEGLADAIADLEGEER